MLRRIRCLLALVALIAAQAFGAMPVEFGEIGGATFAIARPQRWSGGVLLLAHGLRSEDRPLVADLTPEHLAYTTLLG